jgi:hypothetical protein
MKALTILFAALLTSSPTPAAATVLLELFTSEGCSSCPPADALLQKLDHDQPVRGAELIVVSEHVDYWNHLGWSDPFSSPLYSARQQAYAQRFGTGDVYTPQLVVDGRTEVLGSDPHAITKAVENSLASPKLPVTLTATRAGKNGTVRIDTPTTSNADLYLVLAADRARTEVPNGENAGRTLTHVAVAYSFQQVASGRDLNVHLKGETRVIAILRDRKTGQVLGVSQTRL